MRSGTGRTLERRGCPSSAYTTRCSVEIGEERGGTGRGRPSSAYSTRCSVKIGEERDRTGRGRWKGGDAHRVPTLPAAQGR